MNDITIFLPCRSGSERVFNKNTKQFSDIKGGLLELKLKQILDISLNINIVLSTNDEKVIQIAKSFNNSKIIIDNRPDHLCLSSTKLRDLINYVPKIVKTQHVFWLHVTSPFVGAEIYEDAIDKYFSNIEKGYDSIMSVSKFNNFIWDHSKKDIINFDRNLGYPRTQDLKDLYEINHAFFAMSIENYIKLEDRIGKNPYLYELDKFQGFDIDELADFEIAELIFNKKNYEYKNNFMGF